MTELPRHIRAIVPVQALPGVDLWWKGLEDHERESAVEFWDQRRENCFFTPHSDAANPRDEWIDLPRVFGGRFVSHDDSVRMSEWIDDWHEYWLGHEEVFILPSVVGSSIKFLYIGPGPGGSMQVTDRGVVEYY